VELKRLIVAITGASGAIYGVRTLQVLRAAGGVEVHLVISPSAVRTLLAETDFTIEDVRKLGDVVHNHKNIGASIASGSFRTEGMVVVPCSVKSLSGIANCYDEDLIVRAADVCLKERRRLVLMLRETPFHAGHISLMEQATRMGAIIMPPIPSFYNHPKSIEDMVNQSVGRMLDLFDLAGDMVARWTGTDPAPTRGSGPEVRDTPAPCIAAWNRR
jgi:4-hydroxy-3-polyprenylbenzoate decarboxylase